MNTLGIESLASYIDKLKLDHPVKVGIDGVTASGKTTFSANLSRALEGLGRKTINVSLDNFHNIREIRYKDGRNSPEGYFRNAYNLEGIAKFLLRPISDTPEFKFKTEIHDLENDQVLNSPWKKAFRTDILIVDGSFSLRKELRSFFDCRIYLDVALDISEDRAAIRDEALFGSQLKAREMTRNRYQAAHKIHAAENQPEKNCHFLVDNNDPLNPSINRSL